MKKSATLILLFVLLLSFAACAKGEPAAAMPTPTPAPMMEPTAEPVAEPTEEPLPEPKTTLAISEIPEGVYAGILSGDSYSGVYNDGAYGISTDISPAEITVTIRDGQVELYCAADASAGGAVLDVEAPCSPSFTRTVSGALPLSQIDETTVRAEGDLTAPEESPWINWDKNQKFTHWDIETQEGTYHCVVSIAMADGVPMAEIAVDGSQSHRTATVPLQPGPQND